MGETAVAKADVVVMMYNSQTNDWVATGSGLSRVQFCHNPASDAYRVVGWDLQDRSVVLNCAILPGTKYNRARELFHQWRDCKQQVYGLKFTSPDEAGSFATAVESALERLDSLNQKNQRSSAIRPPNLTKPAATPQPTPATMRSGMGVAAAGSTNTVSSHAHLVTGEYMMPRASSAASGLSDRNDSGQPPRIVPNGAATNGSSALNFANPDARFQSSSDDSVKGLIRRSTGPPPQEDQRRPDIASSVSPARSPNEPSQPPPPGNIPPPPANIPPPPPPLSALTSKTSVARPSRQVQRDVPNNQTYREDGDNPDGTDEPQNAFAAELLAAGQRVRAASTAGLETVRSPVKTGEVDMMSDLQRALARRRTKQPSAEPEKDTAPSDTTSSKSKPTTTTTTTTTEPQVRPSPPDTSNASIYATLRQNSSAQSGGRTAQNSTTALAASTDKPSVSAKDVASRADLDLLKRELLADMRRELQLFKTDVIEALRSMANRT